MEYPDIEYLQRLVEHLMKELEASVESFSRLNKRLRTLEIASKTLDEGELRTGA